MNMSRREFLATGLAGAAGICIGGRMTAVGAPAPQTQLPEEDGYRLWLRYAPPGGAAGNYGRVVRSIRVEGTSATCGIIRDELRSAAGALLGNAVPLSE